MAMIDLPPDFKEFLRLLSDRRVEYLLIGGYAVAYHGYPHATADIDIWIAIHPSNAQKTVSASCRTRPCRSRNLSGPSDRGPFDKLMAASKVEKSKINGTRIHADSRGATQYPTCRQCSHRSVSYALTALCNKRDVFLE
jgi:hypothetical protein